MSDPYTGPAAPRIVRDDSGVPYIAEPGGRRRATQEDPR